MVQVRKPTVADNPPQRSVLTQDKFDRGVISLIDESKLPRNALKEADNLTLSEDGSPTPRPGVAYYGTAPSADELDGGGMHVIGSTDATHLLAVAGGTIYRSTDDGESWEACTGATFTSGKKVKMEQANEFTYLVNGWDYPVRYDGTTTLQTYTALTTPINGSAVKTGLASTTYTYRYRVSAVNDVGYTAASTAATVQVDRTRDGFDSSNKVTFSWDAVANAVRYDIYVGQIAGEEVYLDSVDGQATVSYIDQGQAIEQVAIVAPDANTTSGPRVGEITLVGTRLYATADRDNPYRVWISGAGRFVGQFSSAYDATYIDLQEGGQNKPVKVEDYRDGKGTPLATVWCKSKDGRGCIWQGTLETFTVGDVSFPVPSFSRLPGSRGTDAPFSVVNVLNDYMYYNSQAFFNLGSRAQFLNLLSTDEASANIRPDVKSIRQSAAGGIAGFFWDAKVYFSTPVNSDVNNQTMIFDTERKAWLPVGFTIGFERFFPHSDASGDRKMLAWRPGDTKLSEISDEIQGDYGQAFTTSLVTGLMQVNPKDRFQFMWCDEAEVEVAQPVGIITFDFSAYTREDGFNLVDTKTIEPEELPYSWTIARWTTRRWTTTDADVITFSEPSTKRFFDVQKDINAYQFRVTTSTRNANYILRTLQVNGTATQAGKPLEWELLN